MPKTMLVVDDSIVIQKSIGIMFSQEDFAITYCSNAQDALQKARLLNPDIILSDTLMPGKSGYDFCQLVRQEATLKSTPIILLSSAQEQCDDNKAHQAGASTFVIKPCESHVLIQKVKDTMSAPFVAAQTPLILENTNVGATIAGAAPMSYQPEALAMPASDEMDIGLDSSFFQETPSPAEAMHAERNLDHFETSEEAEPNNEISSEGADIWSIGAKQEETKAEKHIETAPEPYVSPAMSTMDFLEEVPLTTPFNKEVTTADLGSAYEFSPSNDSLELDPPVTEPQEFKSSYVAEVTESKASSSAQLSANHATQTVNLSDAHIERIVTQVFQKVIERIAWEVVPDMAERIIKEELSRLTKD